MTTNRPPTFPRSDVIVNSFPSASSSPNNCCFAFRLRIATFAAERDSCSVNIRPSCMSGGLISGQFDVTPITCTLESVRSRRFACTLHPCWMRTWLTELSRASASASTKVMRGFERHLHVSPESSHGSNEMGQRFTKNVVGPDDSNCLATLALMPCTAAEITTTTNTPTATPRMVSAARTLFARIASSAMVTPSSDILSLSTNRIVLFLPQRGHGIEQRRAARGIDAGDDPDTRADEHAHQDGPRRDVRRHRRRQANDQRETGAERDAHRGAERAERRGLDEELDQDVAPLGAERLADADLVGALGDRHEHDVHDDDRAHDEPDGGERDAGQFEVLLDLVPELERGVGCLRSEEHTSE